LGVLGAQGTQAATHSGRIPPSVTIFPPLRTSILQKFELKTKNVKMNIIVDAHPRFRYLTPLPGYQMLADENEWKQNLRFVSVPFEKQKPFSTGQRRKL
jgi:hypothetical protein